MTGGIEELTVVVPCHNEGAQVEVAHREISDALSALPALEILFVDDGSADDTLDRIRGLAATDPRVSYLSFTRNFGLEAAQTAGFRYARSPWCAQLDADLQAPPEELWKLLTKAAEGYDVVFGTRPERHDPWHRRAGSSAQQWIARRLLGIALPPGASTFRLVRTVLARGIGDARAGTPYFIAQIPLVGARYALVPTVHRERTAGGSRWRLSKLVGHSFELYFGYSRRPLTALYAAAVLAPVVAVALRTAAATAVLAVLNLCAVALVGRYLEVLLRENAKHGPFYVREATMPVRPQDTLGEATAPVRS